MLIQCSECSAKYAVPDQSIGIGGRKVRCAKCGHVWFVSHPASAPLAAAEQKAEESIKAKPLPPGSNLPVVKRPPVAVGTKASVFGTLAAAIALVMLWQWPQAYGYPRSSGFALAEVNMFSRYNEADPNSEKPIFELNGKIYNISDETLTVPILRVTLVDDQGAALQYWDFSETGATLEAGDTIPFSTGPLEVQFKKANRFMVELGSEMELSLRHAPE